ncbi:MAG: dihydroneopterin triphosphate diphosphatase [Betaproteobacteria bacterium RBG_16_56_24]|nr:MAG: dihydroneopterin triphosphate diphosphatase [Betaproteobacteria bacterium RBG_16_56_24]
MTRYKQPVSVLVVIYIAPSAGSGQAQDIKVLLLERADHPGYWQSVTGSCEPGETLVETAVREVREETGLDARLLSFRDWPLSDWHTQNVYDIYPQWRYRYPPDISQNTEHVFGLQLPHPVDIQLEPREHLNFQWLAWQDAAEKVFSPSNRAAILELSQRIQTKARVQRKPQ